MFASGNRTALLRPVSEVLNRRRLLIHMMNGAGTLLLTRFAAAAQVAANDQRIQAERLTIAAGWGKLDCYLARPRSGATALAGVIIAHDRLGLTPHFEDVARRFALEGFIALAPDYASRFGGTPSEPGPAREVVGMTTSPDMTTDTETALQWLKEKGGSQHRGAVGFGLGGTAIGYAAPRLPDLMASAIYYGHPTPLADIGGLKAPLLLNLAGHDQFVDPEMPAFVDAIKKTKAKVEIFTYDGTVRGFDDDSAPAHYSAEAAKLAWSRTIALLKSALR